MARRRRRPVVQRALALAVAALVEGERGQAERDGGAGEVVVALLARAGAVEDDHARRRRRRRGGSGATARRPGRPGGRSGDDRRDGPAATSEPKIRTWHRSRSWPCPHGATAYLCRAVSTEPPPRSPMSCPLGTRVNAAGHLELGGCDAVELAREFGTPAYVVVEDDLRARARAVRDAVAARHDDFDVLFASKAFPCTAVYRTLAEEGLACDVASGGELALALAAGFDPAPHLHARQRQVGRRAARGARRRRRPRRPRLPRRARALAAIAAELAAARAGGADPGHPRRGRGHPRQDLHRPGGLEVRLLDRRGARGDRPAPARTARSSWWGCTSTSARSCFELEPFRAAVRAIAGLGDFEVYNLGGGLGAAYTADQHPPSAEEYVEAIVAAAPRRDRARGQAAAARARPGAGGQLDRDPVHGPDRQAQRLDLGGGRRRACPTTCARCSTTRATRR